MTQTRASDETDDAPGEREREGAAPPAEAGAPQEPAAPDGRADGHRAPAGDDGRDGADGADVPARRDGASAAPAPAAQPADPDAPVQIPVPDPPLLAEQVFLRGEMTETAFKEPPYVIELEAQSRYVQVPPLLYQIAEQIDGRRTLAEIATAASLEAKREFTEENARELVGNLMLLGVVALPPEVQAAVADKLEQAQQTAGSPLALKLRMHAISARAVAPLAAIFQWLFLPPVVLAVLAATAAMQFWLFAVHGVGDSVRDAMYTQGAIGLLLLIVVLGAAWHEFGHAAALRYGGGRTKGMGVGIYLVYPAFYTDVSDNYRLPRWARVRTDLGGVYFHLIFALGLMGLYTLTGNEFLLLAILLVDYEIVHQMLPFIRLDGYWTLADMTGVPDFFSRMGPFVRSLLPSFIPWRGQKLPEMKWWPRVVFALYMLVTVPLLAALLVVLVKGVPRILGTGWDAAGDSIEKARTAFEAGQALSSAGHVGQVLLLSVPMIGLIYTLYALVTRLARAWWRFTTPSWPRRAVGGVLGVAFVYMLGAMWLPQLSEHRTPVAAVARAIRPDFAPVQEGERLTLPEVVRFEAAPTPTPSATPTPDPAAAPPLPTPLPTSTSTPVPVAPVGPTPVRTPPPQVTPTVTAEPSPAAAAPAATPAVRRVP